MSIAVYANQVGYFTNGAKLGIYVATDKPELKWSYATNEVAINWNAPLVWVTAYLDQQFNSR